jgi:hypothetical protein
VAIRQPDTLESENFQNAADGMQIQANPAGQLLPPQPPIPHTLRISPRQFFQSSDCGESVSAYDLQSIRSPSSSNRPLWPTATRTVSNPQYVSQRERSSTLRTSRAGDAGESSKHLTPQLSSERSNCSLQPPVAPLGVCVPRRLADRDGTDGWMDDYYKVVSRVAPAGLGWLGTGLL